MSQLGLGTIDLLKTQESSPLAPDELPDLSEVDELGFDTETTGLRWWKGDRPIGLSVAWRVGYSVEVRYLPWGHRPGGNLPEERVLEWARRELRGKKLYGSNIAFDIHMMQTWGVDLEAQGCEFGDVGHRAALLDDHRRTFGLEALSQEFLGEGKVSGLSAERMADYPAWQVTPYARQDAVLALRLVETFRPLLAAQGLERVCRLEDLVIPAVVEMEANGAPIDVELLDRWAEEWKRLEASTAVEVARLAGFAVNPDSSAHLARLFQDRGLAIEAKTATGRASFPAEVLERAAEKDEAVSAVLRLGRLHDLDAKYLTPYRRAGVDGVLRFALHQLRGDEYGTVSGRFSCSSLNGEGFNLQQVMSVSKQRRVYGDRFIIRQLHRAADLRSLVLSADAKQIEFRIFANMTRSPQLIGAYRADPETDFHQVVGDFVHAYRPDLERRQIKNVNFGRLFGAGVKRLAAMLDIPMTEAESLVKTYDAAFPDARRLLLAAAKRAETIGYVKTALGRRARFKDGLGTHSALNRVVQGTAADVCKMKAVALHRDAKRLGVIPRMTIHDEFVLDVPDEAAAAGVRALLQEPTAKRDVPILWDVKTGRTWADAHPD